VALSALCAQVPALVYALSLSLFGMAHVLAEMRYVDGQFGERLGPRAWIPMVALLAAIFTTRLVQIAGGWPPGWGLSVEMGLGLALAAIPLPSLARSGILGLTGGITLCGLWITGWILAPTAALLVFAVSHNATPVGLLIDAAPAPEKARVAGLSAAVFVGIPLWMAVVGWEPLLGPALPWTLPALPLKEQSRPTSPRAGAPMPRPSGGSRRRSSPSASTTSPCSCCSPGPAPQSRGCPGPMGGRWSASRPCWPRASR
jgi:hypothetical protein